MREAFAMQKLLTVFQQKKNWPIYAINVWNFNEMLTNDIVSFEQLSRYVYIICCHFSR